MAWQFVVGPGASSTTPKQARELTEATGRSITWRTRGHATAQFTIDGASDEAQQIAHYVSDLWVRRDGILLFRGRITTISPDKTEDREILQVVAKDYRGMLGSRTLWTPPPTFTATDQASIAWQLIQATQARTGGNWGITQGLAPAGTPRDRLTYPAMKNLRDTLVELGNVLGGFEWEISPELELNIWTPRRGADNGVVLDWGGVVAKVSGIQGDGFANAVGVIGGEGTTPAVDVHADIATDQRGRIEHVESYSTILTQTELNERPARALADAEVQGFPKTLELTAGRWGGKSHIWLGDIATTRLDSPWFDDGPHRLMDIQVTCGDHGTETVRLDLIPEAT